MLRAGRDDRMRCNPPVPGHWRLSIAPGETGRCAGLLETSRVGEDADWSGAISAPRPARTTRHPPLRQIASSLGGKIQRSARSCQRGVVLSDGESWDAGRVMVFQHPLASAGFPEGIQVDGPLVSGSVAPELPEPRLSRKADRSTARQQATPRLACPGSQAFSRMADSST